MRGGPGSALERRVRELGNREKRDAVQRRAGVDLVSAEAEGGGVLGAEQAEARGDERGDAEEEAGGEDDGRKRSAQPERQACPRRGERGVGRQPARAGDGERAEDQARTSLAERRNLVTSSSGAASGWPSSQGTTATPAAWNWARSAARCSAQSR